MSATERTAPPRRAAAVTYIVKSHKRSERREVRLLLRRGQWDDVPLRETTHVPWH